MCFSLEWLKEVLILCIVIGAVILILRLVIPYAIGAMGLAIGPGVNLILAVLRIVFGAIIAIIVVTICFELIGCLLSYANVGSLLHAH